PLPHTFSLYSPPPPPSLPSFPTRRSSDLPEPHRVRADAPPPLPPRRGRARPGSHLQPGGHSRERRTRRGAVRRDQADGHRRDQRSEEHTSELQSPDHLVCRLLLEKKKNNN